MQRPSEPEISVLLPVRDGLPYLRQALQDLVGQRGISLEVLAVEDGSRDGSAELLAKMAARHCCISVLRTGGRGPAAALNLALERARSPLIGQMEADDRCPPDRFLHLLEALQSQPQWHGVVSQAQITGAVSEGMGRYLAWQNNVLTPWQMAWSRFIEIPALHQSGLYRRGLFDQIGAFRDDRWPLDIDFWMRAFAEGAVIGKVPRTLYLWRQHERQSTRTSDQHRLQILRACKVHYFLEGPGQQRALDLVSTGETCSAWEEELRSQGALDLRCVRWQGCELPERRAGAVRLLVFGMEKARRRVRQACPDFDPGYDWFAG